MFSSKDYAKIDKNSNREENTNVNAINEEENKKREQKNICNQFIHTRMKIF